MKWLAILMIVGTLDIVLSTTDYNQVTDSVLNAIKQKLSNASENTIKLPNYQKSFTKHILFFPINGYIEADDIQLGDFSTMRRIGDVEINRNEKINYLSILARFSFDSLLLKIDDFIFNFGLIRMNKPIDVIVNSNKFAIMIEFRSSNETSDKCDASLGFASVDHLGDFQVILGDTGFISFAPEVERVDDIVLDWLVPDITDALNNHMRQVGIEVLEDFKQQICSGFLKYT